MGPRTALRRINDKACVYLVVGAGQRTSWPLMGSSRGGGGAHWHLSSAENNAIRGFITSQLQASRAGPPGRCSTPRAPRAPERPSALSRQGLCQSCNPCKNGHANPQAGPTGCCSARRAAQPGQGRRAPSLESQPVQVVQHGLARARRSCRWRTSRRRDTATQAWRTS